MGLNGVLGMSCLGHPAVGTCLLTVESGDWVAGRCLWYRKMGTVSRQGPGIVDRLVLFAPGVQGKLHL